MNGFLDLQGPADLLAKLRHDLEVFAREPFSSYAAFNFFLTAEHLPDWWHPGKAGRDRREQLRQSNILLQVTSHVANSIKHFRVEAKHHQSVIDTKAKAGVFGNVYGSVFGEVYGRGIFIELDGVAATELGSTVSALGLAKQVLNFWETYQG